MKKAFLTIIVSTAFVFALTGCSKTNQAGKEGASVPSNEIVEIQEVKTSVDESEQTVPVADSEVILENGPESAPADDSQSKPTSPARADGEQFEGVIMIEGMEEVVAYEHIINESLGFEMDYDYNSFERRSDNNRERFISVYDDPANIENYLDVEYRAEDYGTVCASVSESLSEEYEIITETYTLDNAGDCTRIDASCIKGTNEMPEQLQMVYIIPAGDGCIVGTAHYYIVGSEGFGKRFSAMMHTLSVIR